MKLTLKILSTLLAASAFYLPALADTDVLTVRCTNDELDRHQATERLSWLYKCIQEKGGTFAGLTKDDLTNMKFESGDDASTTYRSRPLYPSFIDANGFKLWKAPTDFTASCELPETVATAGFCLSR